MKKTICWILLILMSLGGCAQKTTVVKEEINVKEEIREKVNMPLQHKPTMEPTVAQDGETETGPLTVEGYESFMTVLSAALIDGQSNKNLSPISVYLALAMAAEGARGKTQEEMLALLGEKTIEDVRENAKAMVKTLCLKKESGELALANSIWMGQQDESVTFHEAFLKTLSDSYDAEANAVRFGEAEAGRRIAAWIKEKTRDKVKVSDDAMRFNADTLAVLINTIYLKDGWRAPFDTNMTEKGTFYGPNGKQTQVNYMRRTDRAAAIIRGDGYLRYAMPLRDVGRMVFVLPDEGVSLESLLGSPERIEELLNGGTESTADVNILLPKFSFQDRTDLEETLMGLGVKTCFTGEADFSAMTDTPAYVSRVLQESHIGVDENGVVAAAYTMIAMAKSAAFSMEREKVDFHLTRPFLYTIESKDGTILFIGTVTAPDEA